VVVLTKSSTEGLGESGGVTNSDESLVSSVNDGVLDFGVLTGDSRGGVGEGDGEGEGDGVVDGGPSSGRVGTWATSRDSGLCLAVCLSLSLSLSLSWANGKEARQALRLGAE
jgi:hypothetical protein